MRLVFYAISIMLSINVLTAAQSTDEMAPPARTYLDEALNYMQQNALHKHTINWQVVRARTMARAKNSKTTWDTYPAIAYALTQLGEKHSWFQLPDNLPPDRRQALDAEIKQILARPEPAKPSPFTPSKEMKARILDYEQMKFAYVVIPMCIGRFAEWEKNAPDFQQFADKLHELVLGLQAQQPAGWIVDLRGNGGGNMWPMLAGIGVLLGEGELGAFVSADEEHVPWFYKQGKAGTRDAKGTEEISAQVRQPPLVSPKLSPVAVLFDRGTASSGEAIAISFAGRPEERSFGEHTAGFSTANDMHQFSDGAALFLCSGVEQDRSGKLYPDGLDPDEMVPATEIRPTEDLDPNVLAAEKWLSKQRATMR